VRSDFDLDPDFKSLKAFSMADVPNGTLTFTPESGKSGLLYEWRDGKVVARVDQQVVQSIDQTMSAVHTKFTDNGTGLETNFTGPSIAVVYGAGITALVMVAGFLFFRTRRGT
jgi:hypothetical protein